MEITFKGLGVIATAYIVPTISHEGWVAAWKNRHSRWKHGFVVRILWLGFVLRWGKIPYKHKPYVTVEHPWVLDLYEEEH